MKSLQELDRSDLQSLIAQDLDPEYFLFLAKDLIAVGRADVADVLLDAAARAGEPKALMEQAVLARRQGLLDTALDLATRAHEAGAVEALITIGAVLESMGRLADAAQAYEEAIQADVREGWTNLALLLKQQDKRQLAEENHCKGWAEGDSLAGRNLGVMLMEDHRFAEAQDVLSAVAATDHLAWFDLGNCRNQMLDHRGAASAFEAGALLGDFRCHVALADLLADELDDPIGAERHYRAAIRAGDHIAYLNFGLFLVQHDRAAEATRYLAVAALLGDGAAWHELATLALERNERERAIELLRRAVAAGDDDAQAALDALTMSGPSGGG